MKKRLLSAPLLVCLLLTLLPAPALAATVTGWRGDAPGWAGNWFYFDLTTGVMQTGWVQKHLKHKARCSG